MAAGISSGSPTRRQRLLKSAWRRLRVMALWIKSVVTVRDRKSRFFDGQLEIFNIGDYQGWELNISIIRPKLFQNRGFSTPNSAFSVAIFQTSIFSTSQNVFSFAT